MVGCFYLFPEKNWKIYLMVVCFFSEILSRRLVRFDTVRCNSGSQGAQKISFIKKPKLSS